MAFDGSLGYWEGALVEYDGHSLGAMVFDHAGNIRINAWKQFIDFHTYYTDEQAGRRCAYALAVDFSIPVRKVVPNLQAFRVPGTPPPEWMMDDPSL